MSFDEQVVRPPLALQPLYDEFVLVRVIDMRGIDLERYVFDTDLTFAVLWANADGTVYHRYGGRDVRGAEHWLSSASLEAGMRAGLASHAGYEVGDIDPDYQAPAPLYMEQIPAYQKRDKGACIHCHSVQPARYEEELAAGTWDVAKTWRYPTPTRVGFDLGRDDQRLVTFVERGSAAAHAGLAVGDRLVSVGAQRIATASDAMYALDVFPSGGGELALRFEREPEVPDPSEQADAATSGHAAGTGDGASAREPEVRSTVLTLDAGWKAGTAIDFSWRPFKWGLTPAPGFGGPRLERGELERLGLVESTTGGELPFAFRVQYLVTWGDNARFGQAAAGAGLRVGDVVAAITVKDGVSASLRSVDHFHAWWRLTRHAGEVVSIEVLRGNERLTLELEVVE